MVTSNILPDKKVVKMSEQSNNNVVVPQRTLLGEVNQHLSCPLCRGYYIDATTIVECLHSFCRSCIIKHLQVKSYCPVCEMMINSAKPNIKPDKALQDIVYKLVPGLFQREMERRQQFYASRPGPAASATPEQRGEDTERVIFSPEDVISFSLELIDQTDSDSISSKSSDSNEPQSQSSTSRRFLQCPAVVNISHLKKFVSMKFEIDASQFAIDILYKRVPLPDYYTLMDIAYIYNWKRNEPMRFFYQITDYIAIRTRYRLLDINKSGSHFREMKPSPPVDDLNECSNNNPTENVVPKTELSTDNNEKKISEPLKKCEETKMLATKSAGSSTKKPDEEVEKSQFLNSFELTSRSIVSTLKPVSVKLSRESVKVATDYTIKEEPAKTQPVANEENLKRKISPADLPDPKKVKTLSTDKKDSLNLRHSEVSASPNVRRNIETVKSTENTSKMTSHLISTMMKDTKPQQSKMGQMPTPDANNSKRSVANIEGTASPKKKSNDSQIPMGPTQVKPKTVSPLKIQLPKPEANVNKVRTPDTSRPMSTKKMPDLKPTSGLPSQSMNSAQAKGQQPVGKIRMDLLANNSDPTIDRSKILSQVKTKPNPNSAHKAGDPLKSLFDSCKINIPSSLSITLTDQKLAQQTIDEQSIPDPKKGVTKNQPGGMGHKVPNPPVRNYIEILKLPDSDPKKMPQKPETTQTKANVMNPTKAETLPGLTKPLSKPESSAKGPIPSLKPIADTKLSKTAGLHASPITFQQTFEQQLQSEKNKPKSKLQVPKLMPASPKAISAANKLNNSIKNSSDAKVPGHKSDNVLDLSTSTAHNVQSQLDPQQTKKFETMQTIANLAKKQIMPSPKPAMTMPQGSARPMPNVTPLKLGGSKNSFGQMKSDAIHNPPTPQTNVARQDMSIRHPITKLNNNANTLMQSSSYPMNQSNSSTGLQSCPRATRSPSSSPKLVIAEDKQTVSTPEPTSNQSNQISSSLSGMNVSSDVPNLSPSTSKQAMKPMKMPSLTGKIPTSQQHPIRPVSSPGIGRPTDFFSQSHNVWPLLAKQMEMHNALVKSQRQYELYKNMANMSHQPHNDFPNKDKQS